MKPISISHLEKIELFATIPIPSVTPRHPLDIARDKASASRTVYRMTLWACCVFLCGCESSSPTPPGAKSLESLGKAIVRNEDGQITKVTFRLDSVDDNDLESITDFDQLTSLTIQECPRITDKALAAISGLPELTELRLTRVSCTDEGVRKLTESPKLELLWIIHSGVAGEGLDALTELPLRSLRLEGSEITPEGLKAIPRFTELEELSISSPDMKLQDFPSLKDLKKLKSLSLHNIQITDDSIGKFAGLPALQELELDETGITDAGLAKIASSHRLRALGLAKSQTTDAGLDSIAGLQELVTIKLSPQQTDEGLRKLAALESLEEISALGSQVTGATLDELTGLAHLRLVDLEAQHLSAEGRAAAKKLKAAVPNCKIYAWRGDSSEEL